MINNNAQDSESLPFENYPETDEHAFEHVRGSNCRHEYGHRFIELTSQTKCAYCGLDLVGIYENWLNMALDHVIPHSVCKEWELSEKWSESYANRVLACTACNTFGNRYKPQDMQPPKTLQEFYDRRSEIFSKRKKNILEKRAEERIFFEKNYRLQVNRHG